MACKCSSINIAKMRHKVTFYRQSRTADGLGGFDLVWVARTPDSFAMIKPRSAKEQLLQDRVLMPVIYEFTVRYRSDLSVVDKIVYDSREFNINSIINIEEADRFLLITAIENVNVGTE